MGLVVGLVGLDEGLSRAMARLLSRAGHRAIVWEAVPGKCEADLGRERVDLLLVDESVPADDLLMAGNVPHVRVTGSLRWRVPEAGAVLEKPFGSADLLTLLRRFEHARGAT